MIVQPFVKIIRSGARDENGELPPEVWAERDVAPTLNVMDNTGESRATVLAFAQNQRDEVRDLRDVAGALAAEPGMKQQTFVAFGHKQGLDIQPSEDIVPTASTVRRLTPVECERLQGFPDGWTDGQPDSRRYKQMGNAVCVPVVEWIMRRLVAADGAR